MARKAKGAEQLEAARSRVGEAKTVKELRAAQAVLLQLEWDLTWRKRRWPSVVRWGSPAPCGPVLSKHSAAHAHWGGASRGGATAPRLLLNARRPSWMKSSVKPPRVGWSSLHRSNLGWKRS